MWLPLHHLPNQVLVLFDERIIQEPIGRSFLLECRVGRWRMNVKGLATPQQRNWGLGRLGKGNECLFHAYFVLGAELGDKLFPNPPNSPLRNIKLSSYIREENENQKSQATAPRSHS